MLLKNRYKPWMERLPESEKKSDGVDRKATRLPLINSKPSLMALQMVSIECLEYQYWFSWRFSSVVSRKELLCSVGADAVSLLISQRSSHPIPS